MNVELYNRVLSNHVKAENGCWLWLGAFNPKTGYGQFKYHGKTIRVHRYIAYASKGLDIPEYNGAYPSEVVMHTCNEPLCINPDHLKIGTQAENIQMAVSSGRKPPTINSMPGASNPRALLTNDDIIAIRQIYATGTTTWRQLGEAYNVSKSQIGRIVNNQQWTNV